MSKRNLPLIRRFAEMDLAHPEIWQLFIRFTFEMINRRFIHYSADAVLHRVRWETHLTMKGNEETFKIANEYSCCYARKFRDLYPAHAEFFIYRPSQVDADWVVYKKATP